MSIIGGICATAFITILTLGLLNEAVLFGFPLGYFMLVNGMLLLSIMAVFWASHLLEALDQENNLNEEE